MIITIYRRAKETGLIVAELIEDVYKYSIVANKLHYLTVGDSWK